MLWTCHIAICMSMMYVIHIAILLPCVRRSNVLMYGSASFVGSLRTCGRIHMYLRYMYCEFVCSFIFLSVFFFHLTSHIFKRSKLNIQIGTATFASSGTSVSVHVCCRLVYRRIFITWPRAHFTFTQTNQIYLLAIELQRLFCIESSKNIFSVKKQKIPYFLLVSLCFIWTTVHRSPECVESTELSIHIHYMNIFLIFRRLFK